MSISSLAPISMTSLSQHLEEKKLTNIPNIFKIFESRDFFHRHLAKERFSLIVSPISKLVLIPISLSISLTTYLTYKVGLKTISSNLLNFLDTLTSYAASDSSLKPLVRTMNKPQEMTSDELFNEGISGVCAGSSLYFNYLFTTLINKADIPLKELLVKIANIFVKGGPKEARSIHLKFGSIFTSRSTNKFYQQFSPHLLSLIPDDKKSKLKNGTVVYKNINDIRKLANEPHIIRIFNSYGFHTMSLVKISDAEAFIFDPYIGLFNFEGENVPEQINDYLNKAYRSDHRYYYYRDLRAKQAANSKDEVVPSSSEKFHAEIIPFSSSLASPEFFPSIPGKSQTLTHYPRNTWGTLQYIRDYIIDSIKSSDLANFFDR